jgi:hypothetical protein
VNQGQPRFSIAQSCQAEGAGEVLGVGGASKSNMVEKSANGEFRIDAQHISSGFHRLVLKVESRRGRRVPDSDLQICRSAAGGYPV